MGIFILIVIILVIVIIYKLSLQEEESYKERLENSTYTKFNNIRVSDLLNDKGILGEFLVFEILENMEFKHLLSSVYIPKKNNELTEIDVILVSKKGIFIFEVKNYTGSIIGNEEDKNWIQKLNASTKHEFYNPILQNEGHINALNFYLKDIKNKKYYSYIVFGNDVKMKNIKYTSDNVRIVNMENLKDRLEEDFNTLSDVFTEGKINLIFNRLYKCTNITAYTKNRHIETLKNGYNRQ